MTMSAEDRLSMALGVEQLPEGVRAAVDLVVENRGMMSAWCRGLLAEVITGLPQKVVIAPACSGEGNTESDGGGGDE